MPLLALTLLYGCATDAHGEPDRAHVSAAQAVRDGVVAQDLRAVKQASRRLKRSLRSSSAAGAEAVAAIGSAVDTVEAGEALGRALPHCSACRAREKVTPSSPPEAAPSKAVGQVAAAMRGHGQGAIEMWEGLLFGDLSRVQQGQVDRRVEPGAHGRATGHPGATAGRRAGDPRSRPG